MNKPILISLVVSLTNYYNSFSQQLTFTPANPTAEQQVTIVADVTGTPLAGESNIYMHAGVVTTNTSVPNGGDWKFVKGNWGQDDGIGKMSAVSGQPNKWSITLSATLRGYFNVPAGTNIFYIAMVFRNAAGSKQTSPDIFKSLSVPAYTSITAPNTNDVFVVSGNPINLSGSASELASSLEILVDSGSGYVSLNTLVNASSISTTYTPTSSQTINVKVRATINSTNVESISSFNIILRGGTLIQSLPPNIKDGINYFADPTKATLVLVAPNKSFAYVVGDFNNWVIDNNYLMKRTPDGKRFWFELTGLTAGVEYVFQYWVDGTIKVGDPLADKVSDPYNDSFIPASLYPNLPANTRTNNGIATVLQTNQTPYSWSSTETSWVAPDKKELVIYELLVRDFLASHSYIDLTDTLKYLKRLGVNAIELMPIMEFEGNLSWGYNPSYFLAPDKYYGTKAALKKFIEKAHQNGIAVILDMVLNHAFGQNSMVQMYFDKSANKPSTDNPWFNPDAKHPFNVGYDFNHESQYTKDFVDTVCGYWLKEYHFDGFRFDLSKGFTQTNNPSDIGAWGNYDQSRISILTRMANKIWSVKPNAYVILEHFAASSEEAVLAANGMLLWGNLTGNYSSALKGNTSSGLELANRNSHVNYMESHDEERLMVDLLKNGESSSYYDIKDLATSLNRAKMGAAFFYTVPGPKMLWQFGELGYDKSINLCGNGTENGGCRTDNKPLPWGSSSLNYYSNSDRQRLYKTISAINKLVSSNKNAFKNGSFTFTSVGDFRQINIKHSTIEIAIVGNFLTNYREVSGVFTKTGTWFDYFGNSSISVSDVNQSLLLAPGEFHIYTSVQQLSPGLGLVDFLITGIELNEDADLSVFPNPTNGSDLTVQWKKRPEGSVTFHVLDIMGRKLQEFSHENINQSISIPANLPSGTYILSIIENTNRNKNYLKVIIN
jgi:glycosidase